MSVGPTPAQKLVQTFNDTNYFAKGTYKRDWIDVFSTSLLANFFTKTLLAPLERWRIIKQTQNAYELRPQKFHNFKHYLESIFCLIQKLIKNRDGSHYGEETEQIFGYTFGKPYFKLDSLIPSNLLSMNSLMNFNITLSYFEGDLGQVLFGKNRSPNCSFINFSNSSPSNRYSKNQSLNELLP